jgi:predicted oxidoreductase
MRLKNLSAHDAETLLRTALDEEITFFDHADIYGDGLCETIFANALPSLSSIREKIIIQSKCGIRKGFFDFSKAHILESVDRILARLQTDYLDVLLLHRPDALMEPEEVADAFAVLQTSGKVRFFGVSNFNPMQIELLQKYVPCKLAVNQLQFSLAHTPIIDSGLTVNMRLDQSLNRDGSVLDYCRLHNITVQAWSPFQKGFFGGPFIGDAAYPALNELLDRLAAQYHTTPSAIAVAWITRHPARIQVIVGTTNPQRLIESCRGAAISLTREEWYALYKAAGNVVP